MRFVFGLLFGLILGGLLAALLEGQLAGQPDDGEIFLDEPAGANA